MPSMICFYFALICLIYFDPAQNDINGKVTDMKKDYATMLKEKLINQEPSQVHEIDGIGTVKVYGHWDAEKIINRLLESPSITGYN